MAGSITATTSADIAGPGMPLIVTENGIATADDIRRADHRTGIEDGVNVHGHPAWSALDTYEWGSCRPTLGVIAVDPVTFERTPKPSAVRHGRPGRTKELPRRRADPHPAPAGPATREPVDP